jgi:SAM-dependent methyltransferase
MTQHATDRYTGGTYERDNPSYHEEDSLWKAGLVIASLTRNDVRPSTVCEVGCGAGGVLEELHRELPVGTRCFGWDISPAAIKRCTQKQTADLSFRLGDFAAEPGGIDFDLLLALDVFEHVEDYLGFLRAVGARSRFQMFHIPLDLSVQTVLRNAPLAERRRRLGHLHYFTKDTALASLTHAGYEVLDVFYSCKTIGLTPRARLARQLRKVPFRANPDLTVRLLGGYSLVALTRWAPSSAVCGEDRSEDPDVVSGQPLM